MGYVYLIRNLVNGKCYVGKTELSVEHRWKEHQCYARNNYGNALVHKAIRKYGSKGHELTLDNVQVTPNGYRNCRICRAMHSQLANEQKKAQRHAIGLKCPGVKRKES